jgi:bacterioferritin (cytochrome b1)
MRSRREIMCVLRYRYHYFMASGIHSVSVAADSSSTPKRSNSHADQLARRIKQLGGKPQMNPVEVARRSHSEYREGSSLSDMLREDLIAERIAIETYREMVSFFGDKDSTSRVIDRRHSRQGRGARRRAGGPPVRVGASTANGSRRAETLQSQGRGAERSSRAVIGGRSWVARSVSDELEVFLDRHDRWCEVCSALGARVVHKA